MVLSSNHVSGMEFQASQQVANRIESLRVQQVDFVKGFYNPELGCFNHDGSDTKRVSILSTCLGLLTIFEDVSLWTNDVVDDLSSFAADGNMISLSEMRRSLSDPETVHTSDNTRLGAFRIPFLVLGMEMLGVEATCPKLQHAIQTTIDVVASSVGLPRSDEEEGEGDADPLSMYLLYWNTKSLISSLQQSDLHGSSYIQNDTDILDVFAVLDRAANNAEDNMCRQLAYHYAGDSAEFDVMQLTYALLLHYETSGARGSLICGDQPSVPFNTKLATKALDVIFSQQLENGLWPQGSPIDRDGESMRGDIGNSFVFTFDLLASLLGTIGRTHPEFFRRFLPQLYTALTWAETNVVDQTLSAYCDIQTGTTGGSYIKGWRSNHLGDGGPVLWCTAQVFLSASRLGDLVRQLRNSDILAEFGGSPAAVPDHRPWDRLLDSTLELAGEPASLKETLNLKVLEPLSSSGKVDAMVKLSRKAAVPVAKYSLILYGPPGTAKTTICTSIAQKLGWSFLTVDTADFLASGLQNVASRMTYIFDRLRALEKTVILFDEIEEFCLDRADPSLGMESRMLTTAMLTQLNDLRRQQKCVFLVATNRLRAFDAAVTRPGRFDMILQVGTPGLADRLVRLESRLKATGISGAAMPRFDSDKEMVTEVPAMELARELFERSFEDHIQFLNFAENEAFTDDVVRLIQQRKLADDSFNKLLARHMETATIQGPVREEYLSGFKLSRS